MDQTFPDTGAMGERNKDLEVKSTVLLDLDSLFRMYSGYVAAVAYRILGRDEEVEDIVQDVFLEAMPGIRSIKNPEAIKGWLATITVRSSAKMLRRRRLKRFLGFDEARDYEKSVHPGATAEHAALLGQVYKILDEIPVKERMAWTLRHIEEESLEAVAKLCDCSLATVKRRIDSAQLAIERGLGHEK